MNRCFVVLLLAVFLSFAFGTALAQTVSCPAGGFSISLPDHFTQQPLSSADPDLCLHYRGNRMTVVAYASYLGEVAGTDLFQVLTGNETASGMVNRNGMSMLYASGTDASGAWLMYSWMDRGNNVTLYFYYPAGDSACADTAESIMNSIAFDAGH